jgi:hypothetical protein
LEKVSQKWHQRIFPSVNLSLNFFMGAVWKELSGSPFGMERQVKKTRFDQRKKGLSKKAGFPFLDSPWENLVG